ALRTLDSHRSTTGPRHVPLGSNSDRLTLCNKPISNANLWRFHVLIQRYTRCSGATKVTRIVWRSRLAQIGQWSLPRPAVRLCSTFQIFILVSITALSPNVHHREWVLTVNLFGRLSPRE